MAYTRRKDMSDAEFQKRKAELEKEKDQIAEDTSKLIRQGEDLESLQRKAQDLALDAGTFRRVTPKPAKKSLASRFFGCLPCCGKESGTLEEREPLMKNRK